MHGAQAHRQARIGICIAAGAAIRSLNHCATAHTRRCGAQMAQRQEPQHHPPHRAAPVDNERLSPIGVMVEQFSRDNGGAKEKHGFMSRN